MALTLDVDFTAETTDGDAFSGTLTDNTTYGTGGNPARANGALYVTGQKINYDSTVDGSLTIDTYDPETWATATFDITKDGWHKFKIVFIRDYNWSGTPTYNLHEAVYLDSNNTVYKSISASPFSGISPPNASYWTEVTSPTSLVDNVGTSVASPNLEYQVYERVIYPFAKATFGDLAEDAALECCGDCERGEDVKQYELARVLVEGMNIADQRGKYAKGERMARKADELAEQVES